MKAVLSILLVSAAVAMASPAFACMSPASYRSVVTNVAPEQVPDNAVVLKVRIESGLASAKTGQIQGLRGDILSVQQGSTTETRFEIVTSLGSMCNTWIEVWSSDHDATDGVLTGYIVGYPREVRYGHLVIEPLLFQAAANRNRGTSPARSRVAEGAVTKIDPEAEWRPFRIDAEALANNLERTNELIQADLKKHQAE